MKKKSLKIALGELIGYIISGTIVLGGLVWVVFGIVGDYLKPYGDNFIKKGEKAFAKFMKVDLSFRFWGLLTVVLGVIIFLIVLSRFAKKADLESEKRARRAQRLEFQAELEEAEAAKEETHIASQTPPVS
ncbi:MAG: hypothetical protein ACOX3K_03445 [Bacilli bacterium]